MEKIVKLKEINVINYYDNGMITLIFDNGFTQKIGATPNKVDMYKMLLEEQKKLDIDWNIISKLVDIGYSCGWTDGYTSGYSSRCKED